MAGPLDPFFRASVGAGRANEGLRADWQRQLGQGEARLVERCTGASLLFRDELGCLDKDARVAEQVIDARSKANRPIVVTSGMTPEGLVERYGAAIGRKLMEGGRHRVTRAFGR